MLHTDNKLPTVVRCANELRQQLHDGGSAHLRVILAIRDFPPEIKRYCRDRASRTARRRRGHTGNLEAAIDRTLPPLQPDALFSETEKEIDETAALFAT